MLDLEKAYKLNCPIKNYDWGKRGVSSLVYQLAKSSNTANLDPNASYAELWMGAHPASSGEIEIVGKQKMSLSELISKYPKDILGEKVLSKFGGELPFLMKVLSINSALSIQAHPDKSFAKVLHQRDPKNYPDSNHKPEMAYALSKLELLYGFRDLLEIKNNILLSKELTDLIPEEIKSELSANNSKANKNLLKKIYSSLFDASSNDLKNAQASLVKRLVNNKNLTKEEQWILRLAKEYPEGDAGVFSIYLLRYIELQVGEAIYIGPNIPHAYLSGDLVECMATSDNVVRAGLTNKFKDKQTLISMLSYAQDEPCLLRPEVVDHCQTFRPPVEEFILQRLCFDRERGYSFSKKGPVVILCLAGAGKIRTKAETLEFSPGEVIFLPFPAAKEFSVFSNKGEFFLSSVDF